MSINVIIVDDHPLISNGLINGLKHYTNINVTNAFTRGQQLIDNYATLQKPAVILLDMQMPDMQGPDVAEAILKADKSAKILVLSSNDVIPQVKKMLRIGCKGYLLKDADMELIYEAILAVSNNEEYIMPKLKEELIKDMFGKKTTSQTPVLTKREVEILKLISEELTTQEIAEKLFLSPHTVEKHRLNIIHKLDVKNTAGLIKRSIEEGLI